MQPTVVTLANISNIRTGYTFRGKIEANSQGDVTVLQPKDIINKGEFTEAAKIGHSGINSLNIHLLKKGDILIANKGLRFSVFLYNGTPDKCVASSSFFVVGVDKKKVFPEYLVWYLEQEPAKNHLLSRVTGSIIPTINKSAIQQITIPLPSLTTQEYITELLRTSAEELLKLRQLRERKREFYNSHIWEKIIQETEH
jgi:restriction endonuclease S subunit